jgi:hypothetical protein
MRSGVNIALAIWDEGDDAYDHTELAANWDAIDAHDHSAGKGKQITSAGLASDSVGNSQLAPNSVTTTEIADHTIQSVDIAPGAIGSTEIDPDIFIATLSMLTHIRLTPIAIQLTHIATVSILMVNIITHGWVITYHNVHTKSLLAAPLVRQRMSLALTKTILHKALLWIVSALIIMAAVRVHLLPALLPLAQALQTLHQGLHRSL